MKNFFSKLFPFFLIIISCFLFSISHPSFIHEEGISYFAWICLVPFLFVIKQSSLKKSFCFGFLFGFFCYFIYGNWLFSYRPIACILICILYGIYLGIVSVFFYFTEKNIKKISWLIKALFFLIYEYIKTLGFIGFNYGVIGYTQWQNSILLKSASITGVWGISFLIILINICITDLIYDFIKTDKQKKEIIISKIPNIVFCSLTFIILVAIGNYSFKDSKKTNTVNLLLIQNNSDPWAGGVKEYQKEVDGLIELTEIGLKKHPKTQIVVWPETAVVPDILYNYESNKDSARKKIIDNLLNFMNKTECIFVIGNNYSEKKLNAVKSYNSVLVFEGKKNVIPPKPHIYSKIHLVPFEEYFPFKKQLYGIYKKLIEQGNHFWAKGNEYKVFQTKYANFCTPICFEDTFSSLVKKLCNKNANLIVNLSNDSWSGRIECQYQYLSMAVFRSVENKIPTVRSTSSGQTCYIAEDGRIEAMLNPYKRDFLYCQVKIPVRQ